MLSTYGGLYPESIKPYTSGAGGGGRQQAWSGRVLYLGLGFRVLGGFVVGFEKGAVASSIFGRGNSYGCKDISDFVLSRLELSILTGRSW